MNKEASQHGMVRTNRILPSLWNPKPESRSFQRLNSPPAAGLFSNVPSKPSNHSKFTGKRDRPQVTVSESKDKTKSTQKLRTNNMVQKPGLITWRVVDRRPVSNFTEFSATGILENLYSANEDDEMDHDDHVNDVYDYVDGGPCGLDDADNVMANFWSLQESEDEKGVEFSATGILENLYSANEDDDIDHDDHVNDVYDYVDGGPCGLADSNNGMANFGLYKSQRIRKGVEIEEYVDDDEKITSDDYDAVSFCDVGFIIEQADEDDE